VCKPHAICAGNPKLVGEWFTFRGVFRSYNDNPTFRIIGTGTRRILGALCDEDPIPQNLAAWINDPTKRSGIAISAATTGPVRSPIPGRA
jgi:hypothetical protein